MDEPHFIVTEKIFRKLPRDYHFLINLVTVNVLREQDFGRFGFPLYDVRVSCDPVQPRQFSSEPFTTVRQGPWPEHSGFGIALFLSHGDGIGRYHMVGFYNYSRDAFVIDSFPLALSKNDHLFDLFFDPPKSIFGKPILKDVFGFTRNQELFREFLYDVMDVLRSKYFPLFQQQCQQIDEDGKGLL